MNKVDMTTLLWALRETHKKLMTEGFDGKTVMEVIDDIEHIILFLEDRVEG